MELQGPGASAAMAMLSNLPLHHSFPIPRLQSKPYFHSFFSSRCLRFLALAAPQPHSAAAAVPEDAEHQRRRRRTLYSDPNHGTNALKSLLADISEKNSCPLRLLQTHTDLPRDHLRAVLALLIATGRSHEAIQVFDVWSKGELSRIDVANYSMMIRLLWDENLMQEAMVVFEDMKKYGLTPSSTIYSDMISGFARNKEFDVSRDFLRRMKEDGALPTPESYHGLIRSYGSFGMYDEICKCVKRMARDGCPPNEVTYSIVIDELARSGLVDRMEEVFRTLLSKRMKLQAWALVAMLEAYANLGIVEKMERFYRMALRMNVHLKENLIRRLAVVYIENYRFARLEELGNDVSARTGRTDLVWCILLLACACFVSRKGIESVTREMRAAKVACNVTFMNILAIFYLKIYDFGRLDAVLSQANKRDKKPDIITFGVFFDACNVGYDGTCTLEKWRRLGLLEEFVEMRTDPLVMTAFGKGHFMRDCEKVFSSLGSSAKEKKVWTYGSLISLVFGGKDG